jgi:UDP-N-acetylglucosamine 2-epimerase (non-hydrolysing)
MYKVSVVLGIRPDFIRTSKVLKLLEAHPEIDLTLIHTGQHYDRNLNEVFFEEMGIPKVTHQLDTRGKNHNEQHSKLILQLSDALESINPDVCVFLGDANAVVGAIAPLKLGIPIAHIEAGMRSYNWEMPEERNRVIIDRVADVLYAYQDDYRVQLIQEGIPAHKIVVTGNVIVDVVKEHSDKLEWKEDPCHNCDEGRELICSRHQIRKGKYALMTLHRNEHMTNPDWAQEIIDNVSRATGYEELNIPVVLIEMPRLRALGLKYPLNFIVKPPLGFFEFLRLEANAKIEYTDSGTNQEVASYLGTPCVVTRECTERPECGDCGTTVLCTPHHIIAASYRVLSQGHNENFSLGDGNSSKRIVEDLIVRLKNDFYKRYSPALDLNKMRHFRMYSPYKRSTMPYDY